MRPLLLLPLLAIGLTPASALAEPPIHVQLQQAVETEDWDRAITILDQLIEAEAQDQSDLEDYRQSLIQQQTGQNTDPMQAPESLVYTLESPEPPTLEEAKATLLSVCLDEITTIPATEAEIFCRCTVDQLEQRYPLVEVATDPDQMQISPEDSNAIYEICIPE